MDASVNAGHVAAPLRRISDLPGPKGLPLLGNAWQLDSLQFHQGLENWAREFGPLYKIKLGRKPILVVSDIELIAGLLRDRPDALRRSSRTSTILAELGTSGVFTHEGEEWRRERKLVMRGLMPEVIKRFYPTLVMMTERLRRRWMAAVITGRRVDVLRDLKAYALDVTLGLAMGQDVNCLEHDANPLQRDIELIFYRIARRLTAPIAYWRLVKLPADRAADAAALRIEQAVRGFIDEARRGLAENPERAAKPANMLEALLAARDEPDSGFTDEHVIGNAITMVFAGEDTTSNTIAWLLNFVARHGDVAAAIRSEADTVMGEHMVLQDFAGLDQFSYLDAATNEAMRLKPVAPIMGMETNKEIAVGDLLVPAGTMLLLALRSGGMSALNFDKPNVFSPERWLDGNAAANDDPARKLFPFGGGPRFCPGRFLALAEVRMVASMLVRNFTLTFDRSAPPVKEMFTFTMTPSALPITLSLRT
ncbi:MAG TPA: cytochrome P450 [Burkholderiaceae bacterium]